MKRNSFKIAAWLGRALTVILLIFLFSLNSNLHADSPKYEILRSFGFPELATGTAPQNLFIGSDGLLYGQANGSGITNGGNIFRLHQDGTGFEIIHSFTNCGNWSGVLGPLLEGGDGKLYGITSRCTNGALFQINHDGSGYDILYEFTRAQGVPTTLIRGIDGKFYGTSAYEGGNGNGTLFRLNSTGDHCDVLHEFSATNNADGTTPAGTLLQTSDGSIYGTTVAGGANGSGTLFKINSDGSDYQIIHDFKNATNDGVEPKTGVLKGIDGALYGTTSSGGNLDSGTIYRIESDGSGFSILYNFGLSSDGGYILNGLLQGLDGELYGSQYETEWLTAFKLGPDGSGYTNLYSRRLPTDGLLVNGPLLLDQSGNLIGSTSQGGGFNDGAIFIMDSNGNNYQILKSFSATGGDGAICEDALTLGKEGFLYGVTKNGGTNEGGVIFKIKPDGTSYTLLRSCGQFDSYQRVPAGPLIQESDGTLWGMASGQGSGGSIFSMDTNGGNYTTVYRFGQNANDGGNPGGPLFKSKNGTLFGLNALGSINDVGTLFKIDPDGNNFAVLHSFGNDGTNTYVYPNGAVIEDDSGWLYGVTDYGGSQMGGSIFKIGTNGDDFQIIHEFAPGPIFSGENANSFLTMGRDGRIYGPMEYGAGSYGGIFCMDTNGSNFVVIHQFTDDGYEGARPRAALLQASDGKFYGTTWAGSWGGTVFRINADGSYDSTLKSFTGPENNDGLYPFASLIQASSHIFYGTTRLGGEMNFGTIFKLSLTNECVFALSASNGAFNADGGLTNIALTASNDCSWSMINNNDWITTASPISGSGNQTFTFVVQTNDSTQSRTGIVIFAGIEFHFVQEGRPECVFILSASNQIFTADSGTTNLSLFTSNYCSWTMVNTNDWITSDSPTNGSGDQEFTFTIARNDSTNGRSGTVVIAGQPCAFSQHGRIYECVFSLSTSNCAFTADAGVTNFTLSTSNNCSWTMINTNDWISSDSPTNGSGNQQFNFTIAGNDSTNSRSGTVVIAGQPCIFSQPGKVYECEFSLSATNCDFAANGGSTNLTLSTSNNCSWIVVNTNTWITLTDFTNGNGSHTFNFNVLANSSFQVRSGTVLIAGITCTFNQGAQPRFTNDAGTYQGFVLAIPHSGFFNLKLAEDGSFSGTVTQVISLRPFTTKNFAFSGAFSNDTKKAQFQIPSSPALAIELELNTDKKVMHGTMQAGARKTSFLLTFSPAKK